MKPLTGNRPGKIIAAVAAAGLAAVVLAMIYFRLFPNASPPDPHYDQIYKYCTDIYTPDEKQLAALRADKRYDAVKALQPGVYKAGDDGFLYVFGDGMFQIALPSQLQVVRDFGDGVEIETSTDRPRNVIGCRAEQMARALEVYGLELTGFVTDQLPGAPAAPVPAPAPGQAR